MTGTDLFFANSSPLLFVIALLELSRLLPVMLISRLGNMLEMGFLVLNLPTFLSLRLWIGSTQISPSL